MLPQGRKAVGLSCHKGAVHHRHEAVTGHDLGDGNTSAEMKSPFSCLASSSCMSYAALSSASFRTCTHQHTATQLQMSPLWQPAPVGVAIVPLQR